jgi:hypothetical protein
MAYRNTRSFNQRTAGNQHLACEANTRKGFDIPAKYLNAWSDWQHTDQQTGPIPTGVDVPLYFWYIDSNNGHVGVRLANGQFWSDGTVYGSVAAYNAAGHTPQYRGWSTHMDGVQVLEQVNTPAPVPTPTPSGGHLHLDKGTTTTTFHSDGSKAGSIYAKDDTYNYLIRARQSNRVQINSASGGGNGVWVYLTYSATGQVIPGRHVY